MAENRREVSSRKVSAFHKIAQTLVRWGLHPNHISLISSWFALVAGVAMACAGDFCVGFPFFPIALSLVSKCTFILVALIGIQLRLFCNLIDGLMAVEGGLKTVTGELYNDVPDRFSDIFIIVGAGYSASVSCSHSITLSWIAAIAAVLTAYIRVLGASMGAKHYFIGPMAKQHRMFVMNCALMGSLGEAYFGKWGCSLYVALVIILMGSIATCFRRLQKISVELNSKNKK